ncbi:MAG TPA: Uma2 family endonuclease [Solirubrobacteraceae bacterium]|jgi:Uma2 family endonuclease
MDSAASSSSVLAHRFALDEYHRLIESGGFDEDARVELIEGTIADMSPKTPEHERLVAWLARWLTLAVDAQGYEVHVCAPLTIGDSEPEPDLAVIANDTPQPYHPATATLVIEVAVSSQHRDLRQKPTIYAQALVPEYWVIDLDADRVIAHRDPRDNAYERITEIPGVGRIAPEALGLPQLDVAELLAAARLR